MLKLTAICMTVSLLFLAAGEASALFVDFETLPGGAGTPAGTAVTDSYADWGISNVYCKVAGFPVFQRNVYQNPGTHILGQSDYFGGDGTERIYMDFDFPIDQITVDVATAPGYQVSVIGWNAAGQPVSWIGGSVSPGAPSSFWIRNWSPTPMESIRKLEFHPNVNQVIIAVDNLNVVPEPASALLLLVGLPVLRRVRKTSPP